MSTIGELDTRLLLTAGEVAHRLYISKTEVLRMVRRGEFGEVFETQLGRLFDPEAVERLVQVRLDRITEARIARAHHLERLSTLN